MWNGESSDKVKNKTGLLFSQFYLPSVRIYTSSAEWHSGIHVSAFRVKHRRVWVFGVLGNKVLF